MNELPPLVQIRSLELRLLEPEVRRSVEILDQLLADDFMEFGSSGRVYRKQDLLDQPPNESENQYSIQDLLVRGLSDEVVLATYRLTRTKIGSATPEHSRRSSIWKYEGGGWRLIFHQGTSI